MHDLDKKTRRLASILGSLVIAGPLVATATSASATAVQGTPKAAPTFVLQGTVSGGIKTIQSDQTLTFVFTETNKGPGPAPEDLVVTRVVNAQVVGNPTCVLPNGFAINSDGFSCEPGPVAAGQSSSTVVTTNVTGISGSASVRVCLENENTGVIAPCLTVSVKIA